MRSGRGERGRAGAGAGAGADYLLRKPDSTGRGSGRFLKYSGSQLSR